MSIKSATISSGILVKFGFSDPAAAAREIEDLVESAFGPFEPEAATMWRSSAEEDLTAQQSAALFREAADADDPLSYLDERSSFACAQLNALMRTRWAERRARSQGLPSSLVGRSWSSLTDKAHKTVRDGLLHLAIYHATHVRRGPPAKVRTDAVLDDLAEIFARHRGFTGHQTGLPHAQRGLFIQLVRLVLKPYLPSTELEADALSKRWKRFKRKHGFGSNIEE